MALSYVSAADYTGNSGALPTFAAGDLALVFAYRDGNATAPALPAGWTNIASSGANSNSSRVGYRVLQPSDTTSGTWTNATELQVLVLRGQHASPIGGNGAGGATASNQISYSAVTFIPSAPQGASWVAGFAGHRTATDVNGKAVSGMTTRSGDVTSLGVHTAQGVGSFSASNYTTTVNTSAAWRSYAVEIRAAATTTSTGTARVSMAPGSVPSSRTNHYLSVRARVLAATGETLRVALYEGSTNITDTDGYLETSALTTAFVSYQLAIADVDAAAIGSYSDLEVRVWGSSLAGNPSVFEVAELSLHAPAPSVGTQYGNVDLALTLGATTNGQVSAAGTKATGAARLSLAGGLVPETRTGHIVTVRARRTALQGKLRAQLYEGSSPIGAVLETSELTTSLASYELALADADAATIGSYADLELRLWGYSSTGTATVFEIAEATLRLPVSSTGGDVLGAAVLSSTATVSVGAALDIYPATNVYPYPLITVGSTGTITIAGVHDGFGQVVMPLTLGRYVAGNSPSGNREGAATFASTVSISFATSLADRLGAFELANSVVISITVAGLEQTGQLAVSATATISIAGDVPAVPAPPSFVATLADMPLTLVAVAFTSQPFDPLQEYSGVTAYTRTLNARKGRQFKLDRFEAGNASLVLSNNDSRFNPENTSSPYYPNVEPTHRLRWQAFWSGQTYDMFHGFLEGYPQEFPSLGHDALVRQRATDYTMSLSLTKFVPGSTFLASDLPAIASTAGPQTGTLDVAGTGLPMPQAPPFAIKIDSEEIAVNAINSAGQYAVTRAAGNLAHTAGAVVTTTAVSFGGALSGERIRQVLERIGVAPGDYAVDDGQTLLAPSEDIAGQAPIDHLTLVSEVEGGRLFISNAGKVTFYERHRPLKTELAPRATFGDNGSSELPYHDVEVTHDQEHIYNVIRITTASGYVAEARDQASIDQHFERVLEKQWPLANDNDADAAVRYLLANYSSMRLRVPSLTLLGRASPAAMWPHLLGMEIGQRFRFIRRVPGTDIDKELIVEGVARAQTPTNLETTAQLSLAETTHYWRLGVAGYSELGSTTRVVY